jgi:DNA-binding MarR family transcriptional regulator
MGLDFTPAEKKVLTGLVTYPRLNDRQLSEKIGVKPSTTTAIRRRLRSKDVFHTKRIPMGNRLGYELLVTVIGKIRPNTEKSDLEKLLDWINGIPGIFFAFKSSDSMFCVGLFKNFSEYRVLADKAWEDFGERGPIDPNTWKAVIFSLERSKLVNYFDYSSPSRSQFGGKDKKKFERTLETVTSEKLTKKEKMVLQGLVAFPESSDKTVAEKVGASRQAVSSMRKKFEDADILRTIRVLDLQKIGMGILAVGHLQFQPQAPLAVRWEGVERTASRTPTIFWVSSSPETMAVGLMSDYDQLHKLRRDFLEYYAKKGYYKEDPDVLVFPLSDTEVIKDFDFSGFMKRIVEED